MTIERFWEIRNPTPGAPENPYKEEHYRRLQYAIDHFSSAKGDGWKTDMGGTYIQYGPPDEIVRNPFRFDGPPEEIWYYYQSRRVFTFVDRDGFGRYELDRERSR